MAEQNEPGEPYDFSEVRAGEVRVESVENSTANTGKQDKPARIDHAGNEIENGPAVDPEDPNLSEVMTEAGAQEDRASLGMRDEDEMRLEDPEGVE